MTCFIGRFTLRLTLLTLLVNTGNPSTGTASSLIREASTSSCQLLDAEWRAKLKEELESKNCLQEVELVPPEDVQRAARLFHRDGFVVVKDALTPAQVQRVRAACDDVVSAMLARDPQRLGNRGPYRYSFAGFSKTGHVLHKQEFAELVDVPTITPILQAIFGDDRYICNGARGDFNLPGAVYQVLHSDTWPNYFIDPAPTVWSDSGRLNSRDLPVFNVAVNFVVSNITALSAPIRHIPMTQNSQRPIPSLDDEPLWMKRSTICPVNPGTVIIRDVRAWHGGTPNLSDDVRCLPNVEYFASWFRFNYTRTGSTPTMPVSMPREVYSRLSPVAQRLCREIVAEPGHVLDTAVPDDVVILQSDAHECYKKMGLTAEQIDEYKKRGKYYDYSDTHNLHFYGRRTDSTDENKHDGKREEL